MRQVSVTTTVLMAVMATSLGAQDRDSPKAKMLHRFEENATHLLGAVMGLTEAQWNFKSAQDRWSIAEVMEHIVLNEEWTFGLMTQDLTERDVSDDERQKAEQGEAQLEATFRDRSRTFQAPEAIVPTGRWLGGDPVIEAFGMHRRHWREFIEQADFDLRSRVASHPILGPADVHLWAVAIVEHGNRHLAQIREVMEHPDYPSS